ncbi:DUF397 domain-containing protein [Actinokineospora iranica]|uniref:DUF397 domain-containing protein n=1 Tax=Actinokineospora iranica TaxID=1271860 RepID=A0A1G6P1N7_9PSEU|nr:DUF397 domain-containing protein [Actinokineospora iranica]SDC73357.1 protein of unknown function [Actinokineospora iranica]
MALQHDYLPAEAFADATWQKATASQPNQSCVEFAKIGRVIGVRDSKLGPDSPILQFTEHEIAAMLTGAKDGEFDHLA